MQNVNSLVIFFMTGGVTMAFAENVKRLREEKGLSQYELATQVDVAQSMIAQYEKGLKVPTILTGVILAQKLGTTCEELVLGEGA